MINFKHFNRRILSVIMRSSGWRNGGVVSGPGRFWNNPVSRLHFHHSSRLNSGGPFHVIGHLNGRRGIILETADILSSKEWQRRVVYHIYRWDYNTTFLHCVKVLMHFRFITPQLLRLHLLLQSDTSVIKLIFFFDFHIANTDKYWERSRKIFVYWHFNFVVCHVSKHSPFVYCLCILLRRRALSLR